MGLFALIKLFIPFILEGIKEVLMPKSHTDNEKTSIGLRICILIIAILLLLLGFVTDKLYLIHTDKAQCEASVTILNDRLNNCGSTVNIGHLPPHLHSPSQPTGTIKTPPSTNQGHDLNHARNKMIDEINLK